MQRIIRLAKAAPWPLRRVTIQLKRGDFYRLPVNFYRHIYCRTVQNIQKWLLLYIPYGEKENFSDLYTYNLQTTEGRFYCP